MAVITPTATNVGVVKAHCARLETMDRAALLKLALDGTGLAPTTAEAALNITAGGIAAEALQLALDGYATFEYQCQTETNDALVINFTDTLGIDFLTVGTFRRISWEVFANADADVGMVVGDCIVQGAATPIVSATLQTAVADIGLATIETGRLKSVAAGDLLASAVVVPFIVFSQSSNDIIATFTGISNIDINARVKFYVYPAVTQALFPTD